MYDCSVVEMNTVFTVRIPPSYFVSPFVTVSGMSSRLVVEKFPDVDTADIIAALSGSSRILMRGSGQDADHQVKQVKFDVPVEGIITTIDDFEHLFLEFAMKDIVTVTTQEAFCSEDDALALVDYTGSNMTEIDVCLKGARWCTSGSARTVGLARTPTRSMLAMNYLCMGAYWLTRTVL